MKYGLQTMRDFENCSIDRRNT